VSELIDTTEMYLRTIFELQEEGHPALRARIAERLEQSGPTVSQTVARMERDGLLHVGTDRQILLTDSGERLATRVMRKHRLAECMLIEIIGLPWEEVHAEACRWEHVMSDTVERRVHALLGHPTVSPFGNPIPGLEELDSTEVVGVNADVIALTALALVEGDASVSVTVRRIDEPLQNETPVLAGLARAGVRPGSVVNVTATAMGVIVGSGGEYIELVPSLAQHVLVEPNK
jgi:DtxR family transcriptional regulator, Mn-dependent transcriptional regulator